MEAFNKGISNEAGVIQQPITKAQAPNVGTTAGGIASQAGFATQSLTGSSDKNSEKAKKVNAPSETSKMTDTGRRPIQAPTGDTRISSHPSGPLYEAPRPTDSSVPASREYESFETSDTFKPKEDPVYETINEPDIQAEPSDPATFTTVGFGDNAHNQTSAPSTENMDTSGEVAADSINAGTVANINQRTQSAVSQAANLADQGTQYENEEEDDDDEELTADDNAEAKNEEEAGQALDESGMAESAVPGVGDIAAGLSMAVGTGLSVWGACTTHITQPTVIPPPPPPAQLPTYSGAETEGGSTNNNILNNTF